MKHCPHSLYQSGQILVAAVLVMVVSLIVGVAVSSRSLSSLRSTTYTTQATSAFHAAEAGVEKALYDLDNSDFDSLDSGDGAVDGTYNDTAYLSGGVDGPSYSFTVEESGGGGSVYVSYVPKDSVAEVKLGGYLSSGASELEVCWNEDSNSDDAVLLISYVSSTAGTREAYYSAGTTGLVLGDSVPLGSTTPVTGGYTYRTCTDVFASANTAGATLIRVTPLDNDTVLAVVPDQISCSGSPCELPAQAHVITSVGSQSTTQRTLKVTKTLPALPSIFDFAIYSGSTTDALSK